MGPGYSAVTLTDKNGAESYIKSAADDFIFLQVSLNSEAKHGHTRDSCHFEIKETKIRAAALELE